MRLMPEGGSVHARTLIRAAEIVGGVAALSAFLDVPQSELMRWIRGEEEPTTKVFLDVVDLLLDHDLGKWSPRGPTRPR